MRAAGCQETRVVAAVRARAAAEALALLLAAMGWSVAVAARGMAAVEAAAPFRAGTALVAAERAMAAAAVMTEDSLVEVRDCDAHTSR